MFRKIFPGVMIVTAVVLSVLAVVLPPDRQRDIQLLYTFFQNTLPVLAFAALAHFLMKK